MRNKILALIGIVTLIIVAVVLITKNKKSAAVKAVEEEANLLLKSLDLSKTAVKDTSEMTIEEKLEYEAEIAKETELRAELNALKLEYKDLFGVPAPIGSTSQFLKSEIERKNKYNEIIIEYQKTTGDTDLSDNNFVTIPDVQLAIEAYNVKKAQDDAALALYRQQVELAWNQRKTYIASVISRFWSDWANDGTALRRKAWDTALQAEFNALSDRDLVYAERINYLARKSKSLYQMLTEDPSTKREYSSRYTALRGKIANLNSRYSRGTDRIDIYGNLI